MFPSLALALTLFLTPFFPDEKLNRLKLISLGAGLTLTGLLWACSRAAEKKFSFARTPLDIPLAVYAALALFFYKSSANPATAASEFQRMIFSVGAFFVAVQTLSGIAAEKKKVWAVSGWAAGLLLISLYGVLQKSGGIGQIQVPQMERVFATFGNPIFFAAFLILSIPVVLGAFLESKKIAARLFYALALFVSAWALFYTGTRAAFLALPLALIFFYVLLELPSGWTVTKKLWTRKFQIFPAIAVLAALLLFSSGVREKIRASRMTATSQTHTLIWKDVLKMWKAHPWTGTGFGTFHIEFPAYASDELKAAYPQNERIVNDAHNEFLQILAETGLAGFAVFMSLLILFYVYALKFYAGMAAPSPLLAGILSGALALLIENFFSVDMRFIISSTYLFLAMGFAASYFSTEISFVWPGTLAKGLWVLAAVAASGVLGLVHKPFDFGLLPSLLRPYQANRELKNQPDFFEQKYPQSIEGLEEMSKKFPGEWKVWDKLGFAYAKIIEGKDFQGKKVVYPANAEKSVNAYMKAFQLNPAAEGPPNNIGNIFYTMRKPAEAIEWWKRAVTINPEKIDARLNLSIAYYSLGRVKDASQQLEEVLKRDPQNKTALVMLKRMVE